MSLSTCAEPSIDINAVDIASPGQPPGLDVVRVFDLAIAPLSLDDTLDRITGLVDRGIPSYVITANLNYAMLSAQDPRLEAINEEAAFILADGMPLVWAARLAGTPLPGRTTGADLVPRLCARAAQMGLRVFLVGGLPEVTHAAAKILCRRAPDLNIVGIECPRIDESSDEHAAALAKKIRAAKPDIVLVAFGQPKGELWIAEHYRSFGNAVCLQIGASLDFVAGHVRRAPVWMQRMGLEWLYRVYSEPRRLWRRYADNGRFLLRAAWRSGIGSLDARWSRTRGVELKPQLAPHVRLTREHHVPSAASSRHGTVVSD